MGKTIRGARKGKNSIFTAHTRLRKGPVRLRKIDYAEKCAGRVPSQTLLRPTDWRNGSASDSSPEGYVFESRIGHSSTEPRWSGGWTSVPQPFRDGAVRFRLGCDCWIGVVVITSALHAVGHRFEPGIQ